MLINASGRPLSIEDIPLDDIEAAFEGASDQMDGCSTMSTPVPPKSPGSRVAAGRFFVVLGIEQGGSPQTAKNSPVDCFLARGRFPSARAIRRSESDSPQRLMLMITRIRRPQKTTQLRYALSCFIRDEARSFRGSPPDCRCALHITGGLFFSPREIPLSESDSPQRKRFPSASHAYDNTNLADRKNTGCPSGQPMFFIYVENRRRSPAVLNLTLCRITASLRRARSPHRPADKSAGSHAGKPPSGHRWRSDSSHPRSGYGR